MLSVNEDRTQPRSCQSLPVFHDSRNENDRKDTCYIERYGEGSRAYVLAENLVFIHFSP